MLETGLSVAALVFLLSRSSVTTSSPMLLATEQYSLKNRNKNFHINEVFSDNILLTLAYMRGIIQINEPIPWDIVRSSFTYGFILKPGETFAFHDSTLDEYKSTIVQTTNAHFISSEGFKSDGWLVGDGVCHLASFINVAAKDAGLTVEVPTNHNFATIADVPKSEGVSIYYTPNSKHASGKHNLYITNSLSKPVAFLFEYSDSLLTVSVSQL